MPKTTGVSPPPPLFVRQEAEYMTVRAKSGRAIDAWQRKRERETERQRGSSGCLQAINTILFVMMIVSCDHPSLRRLLGLMAGGMGWWGGEQSQARDDRLSRDRKHLIVMQ